MEELGFRVSEISNFAVHFGWEGAWVGPLHVVGTATKNTYSQWLSIFHTLGMQDKFEEYILGFKIDVRTHHDAFMSGGREVNDGRLLYGVILEI